MMQGVERDRETDDGESDEGCAFQQDGAGVSEADRGVAEDINLPGDRIGVTDDSEYPWERLERIEHRAHEQEHEVEDRGHGIEGVVSTDAEREVERFWKQSKRVIKLLRVQEILDEEIAQKMA